MWEMEDPGKRMSSTVNLSSSMRLAIIHPKVSMLCVTPFGLPVLPEVKKIKAGAFGSETPKLGDFPAGLISSSNLGLCPNDPPQDMKPSGSFPAIIDS